MIKTLTNREHQTHTSSELASHQLSSKVPLPHLAGCLMLVGFENPFQTPIRRAAQALGMTVLHGANAGPSDKPELIVASLDSYAAPKAQRERRLAQQTFPDCAICVLLDGQGHAPDQQLDEHDFDGSEALLQASGFRFLGLAAGEAQ